MSVESLQAELREAVGQLAKEFGYTPEQILEQIQAKLAAEAPYNGPLLEVSHIQGDAPQRMTSLSPHSVLRVWLENGQRIFKIQLAGNYNGILVESFKAPGGFAYTTPLIVRSVGSNSVVIR